MTSGLKNLVLEAMLWISVVASVFFSVFYFDELKVLSRTVWEAGFAGVADVKTAARQQIEGAGERSGRAAKVTQSDNFGRSVRLKASRHGHFYAQVWINGRSINVMVDTGASGVALTHEDAETIGVFVGANDYTRRSNTANGIVLSAPVTLDSIRMGDIEVDDVNASVSQAGRLHITLLGMTFLRKLAQVQFKGDTLILTQ